MRILSSFEAVTPRAGSRIYRINIGKLNVLAWSYPNMVAETCLASVVSQLCNFQYTTSMRLALVVPRLKNMPLTRILQVHIAQFLTTHLEIRKRVVVCFVICSPTILLFSPPEIDVLVAHNDLACADVSHVIISYPKFYQNVLVPTDLIRNRSLPVSLITLKLSSMLTGGLHVS